jgi:hypothetical protein
MEYLAKVSGLRPEAEKPLPVGADKVYYQPFNYLT